MKNKDLLEKIKNGIGDEKVKRGKLLALSQITPGQLAGFWYRFKDTTVLKREKGLYWIQE